MKDKGKANLKLLLRKLHEFNAGSKYFIRPRLNKIWFNNLTASESRMTDFYFPFPFEKRDTSILLLTDRFKLETPTTEKQIDNPYGYYHSKSWWNEKENAVYTATTLILKKHKVLAADYTMVKSFFDAVLQDDSQRIIVRVEAVKAEKKSFLP